MVSPQALPVASLPSMAQMRGTKRSEFSFARSRDPKRTTAVVPRSRFPGAVSRPTDGGSEGPTKTVGEDANEASGALVETARAGVAAGSFTIRRGGAGG